MRTTLRPALMLIAALVAASPVFGQVTDEESSVVGGEIHELCQLRITGTVADLLNFGPDGEGEAAYDAGFITSSITATTLTIDANTAWDLTVNRGGGWTVVGGYTKDAGDLLIRITNTPPNGTIAHGYGSVLFKSPPNLAGDESMLADDADGVSNEVVHIQTKVKLDWTKDKPGVYSITVVYTLAAEVPA